MKEYIKSNYKKIIVDKTIQFIILAILFLIVSKVFNYPLELISFILGGLVMLVVLEIISYRNWLRLGEWVGTKRRQTTVSSISINSKNITLTLS